MDTPLHLALQSNTNHVLPNLLGWYMPWWGINQVLLCWTCWNNFSANPWGFQSCFSHASVIWERFILLLSGNPKWWRKFVIFSLFTAFFFSQCHVTYPLLTFQWFLLLAYILWSICFVLTSFTSPNMSCYSFRGHVLNKHSVTLYCCNGSCFTNRTNYAPSQ